jgi:uncharacterized surface protein with fasciclin (FAS1) repeats
MTRIAFAAAALAGTLVLGACSESTTAPLATDSLELAAERSENATPEKGMESIAGLAVAGGYTELVGALAYVDLELGTSLIEMFSEGTAQYTVFAPTNDAFQDLYALLSSILSADIDEITDIAPSTVAAVLEYHVVNGRRAANSVVPRNGERTMTPLLGETFSVRTDGTIRDGLTALDLRDDAAISAPNGSAFNGIVHEISQVIVPPSVVAALTGS